MEGKTVMLINPVVMTILIPLYVKITACGGDVTFWKLNHITVIITIYRECYHIKRNVGIV